MSFRVLTASRPLPVPHRSLTQRCAELAVPVRVAVRSFAWLVDDALRSVADAGTVARALAPAMIVALAFLAPVVVVAAFVAAAIRTLG